MKNKMNRKEFLKRLPAIGATFIGGGIFIHSCQGSKTSEDPCSDLSKLSAEEKQTRKDFEYVAKSPFPDKLCSNCELWLPAEEGKTCGGCEIMEGPINPNGHCNGWAKAS